MLDIGLARSHIKYLTLGKSPSDDNASSLPVFEGWFRLFCYTNVVWIVTWPPSAPSFAAMHRVLPAMP